MSAREIELYAVVSSDFKSAYGLYVDLELAVELARKLTYDSRDKVVFTPVPIRVTGAVLYDYKTEDDRRKHEYGHGYL